MRNFSLSFIILLFAWILVPQEAAARTNYQGLRIENSIIVNSSSGISVYTGSSKSDKTSDVGLYFNMSSYAPLYNANSYIIGKGADANTTDYDVAGNKRNGKMDLGAYEFKRISAGSITGNTAIFVPNGTLATDAITRPVKTITVEYTSANAQTIKVEWSAPANYVDGASPGEFIFTGVASYNDNTQIEFFELPAKPTISVTVNNRVIFDPGLINGKIKFYKEAACLNEYTSEELKNMTSNKEIYFLPIPDQYYQQKSVSAYKTGSASTIVTTSEAGNKEGLMVYKCTITHNTTVSAEFKDVRNVFDLSIHGPLTIQTAASGDMSISYNKPGVGKQTALPLYTTQLYLSSSSITGNTVTVKEGNTANITLQGLSIVAESGKTAFALTGNSTKVSMTLQEGTTSSLASSYGGSSGSFTGIPGIAVPQNTELTLDGAGKLEVKGGGAVNSPNYVGGAGIGGASGQPMGTINVKGGIVKATGGYWAAGVGGGSMGGGGTLKVTGGTLYAIGGYIQSDGKTGRTSGMGHGYNGADGTIKIDGGSVHATCEHDDETISDRDNDSNRPANTSSNKLYMITVTTSGLLEDVMYITTYPADGDGSGNSVTPFLAAPDINGQYFFWMKEDTNLAMENAVFKDANTKNQVASVGIIQIEKHDQNIAPIAVRILAADGKPKKDYGSLKDAFDVVQNGETIQLLRNLSEISTTQAVKEGMRVMLNLNGFELATRSDNSALFDASASGSGLVIAGNGTLKTNFRVKGNVYIDAQIGLTDARVTTGDNNIPVWRTLVNNLPSGESSIYNYSYATQNDVTFYLNQNTKLACLWLPESQEELPLSIKVTSAGLVTQYTCGNLASKTHMTDPVRAYPVGVVAKVTKTTGSTSYPTINAAFTAANEKDALVTLLAPITLSSSLTTMPVQDILLDLAGFSMATSVGQNIQIPSNGTLTVKNSSTLVRGSITSEIQMKGETSKNNGYVFIPGAITLTGKVTYGNKESYRLIVDVSQIKGTYTEIIHNSQAYKVVNGEACLWMETETGVQKFTVNGQEYTVSALTIAKDHNNVVSLGGSDKEASVLGTVYDTFKLALDALNSAGDELILLKSSIVSTLETLSSSATFQLGNNTLSGSGSGKLTVGTSVNLVVTNGGKTGGIQLPLDLANTASSRLYIGTDVDKTRIGNVSQGATKLYRLLVSNLPETMGDGTSNTFTYNNYSGGFIIRNRVACLWLPEAVAKELSMEVAGAPFSIENVTINPDHGNTDKYGVSQVAQVVGGEKYSKLSEALSAVQSGGVVELLKSAALDNYSLLNSVTIDLKGYSVVYESGTKSFTIPSGKQLQVKGAGNMKLNLNIQSTSDTQSSSNANLWVNPEVDMTGSTVKIGNDSYYQTIVTGLKGVGVGEYEYGEGVTMEQGTLTPSGDGTLCLWLKSNSISSEFRFTTQGANPKTYLRGGVSIPTTHGNQIPLIEVTAEATTGGVYYNTLKEALAAATSSGQTVNVQKHLPNLSGVHSLAATSGTVTLDLENKKITADGVAFSTNGAVLLSKNGILEGNLTLTDAIFMSGSVQMGNTVVMKNGKTVWRLLLSMPTGTQSISYAWGNGQSVNYSYVQEIDGKAVACLWLPSSIMGQTLTVKTKDTSNKEQEYVLNNIIVAATHGNELDVENGNNPVASINGILYASLASAFSAAQEGETILLERAISSSTIQEVSKTVTLNLNGYNYTSVTSGFHVANDKNLTIQNSAVGKAAALIGAILLTGDGDLFVDATVRISGAVLDKENKAVYRGLIKVGPTATVTTCHWLYPNSWVYDYELISSGDTYEATIPANFTDHNTKLTAYKRVMLTNNIENWVSEYANTNLVLSSNVVLTAQTAATLHRLTIYDGAKVKTTPGANVIATEGIHYKRTFATVEKWESIALPFTAARIEMIDPVDKTIITPLSPATGSGTAGYFWLTTVDNDGSLKDVTSSEITANVGYLMAVPSNLQNKEITFVSGENQLLNRNARVGVQPVSGFASYANEALDDLTLTTACYVLADNGQDFVRIQSTAYQKTSIPPFRGYLFADPATTAITTSFRAGNVPTATETPSLLSDLRITAGKGHVILESERAHYIAIYSFSGRCIRAFSFAGGRMRVALTGGFYIVNRKKIFVKQ